MSRHGPSLATAFAAMLVLLGSWIAVIEAGAERMARLRPIGVGVRGPSLVKVGPVPPPEVVAEWRNAFGGVREPAGELFGDPMPGRSALDKKRMGDATGQAGDPFKKRMWVWHGQMPITLARTVSR